MGMSKRGEQPQARFHAHGGQTRVRINGEVIYLGPWYSAEANASYHEGDPGSLTFHQGEHEMLLDHLTSEQPITVEARGRSADQWKLLPGRDNHLLDCLVMAAVAASVSGINSAGAEATTRQRKRVDIPTANGRKRIEVKRWR